MSEKRYDLPKKIIRERLKEVGTTDADIIIAYLQGYGDELDTRLLTKLERLEYIGNLIRLHGSKSKVVPMVIKKYDLFSMEAYRLYDETVEVLGSTCKHNRELSVQHNLDDLKALYRICLQYKDFKTAAAVQKNITYIIEKFFGDKDNDFDWSSVQPKQINIAFMPEQMNLLQLSEEDLQKQLRRFKAPAKKIIDISVESEDQGDDGEA